MRPRREFDHGMSKVQMLLGWLFLPMNQVVLPVCLGLYAAFTGAVSESMLNLAVDGATFVFLLVLLWRWLRRQFDHMLDDLGGAMLSFVLSAAILYVLSLAVSLLLLALLPSLEENPNDVLVGDLARENYGLMKALAVFIGPVNEELMYRGVVFGSIRRKNRLLAYAVSILIFAFAHVWQFLLYGQGAGVLLYLLQYLPAGFALAYCYERSNSIWPCIFLHMGYNGLAFLLLG